MSSRLGSLRLSAAPVKLRAGAPYPDTVAARLPGIEARIGGADVADALGARRERIRLFAAAHLPPSAEGIALVRGLDRFLADHENEICPALLDALAAYLRPKGVTRGGPR
ncbi:MAG: hypothetical protein AB1726_10090 [Planctomycetota bacterium]